jgi:hypothetical protein
MYRPFAMGAVPKTLLGFTGGTLGSEALQFVAESKVISAMQRALYPKI